MTISRATMKQQLKGNRMPKYKTKKGTIKTVKPIPKAAQSLLGMKNVKKKASGGKMKKKPVTKAKFGKFLEATSPLYSAMKGKGLMENLPSGLLGGGIGLALGKNIIKKKGAKAAAGAAPTPAAAPQGMTATPMAGATPLKGGGRTKNKKPVVKAFAGLSAKLDPIGMATRVIKKSSPEKFANFQKEVASKFGGDPNFKKAMKKLGVPTLAAAPRMMSSGGSLNRKKSVDGIAQRGKTRAR